jgi:general stress protein YciG
MFTYTIYHIYGWKCGCTKNLERRFRELYQPKGFTREEIEVLEVLSNSAITPQEAGDIEWAWADRFGYSRGKHYAKTKEAWESPGSFVTQTRDQREEYGRKGGRISGPITGRRLAETRPHEKWVEIGQMGSRARMANTTPEQRSEIARVAGLVGARKGGLRSAEVTPPEQRSANARKGGLKGGCVIRGRCPHCGHETNLVNIRRHVNHWHRRVRFVRGN